MGHDGVLRVFLSLVPFCIFRSLLKNVKKKKNGKKKKKNTRVNAKYAIVPFSTDGYEETLGFSLFLQCRKVGEKFHDVRG